MGNLAMKLVFTDLFFFYSLHFQQAAFWTGIGFNLISSLNYAIANFK